MTCGVLHRLWSFQCVQVQQCLGESIPDTCESPEQYEACVTCIRYDDTGNWMAVGTKGGEIKLYQRTKETFQLVSSASAYQTQIDPLNRSFQISASYSHAFATIALALWAVPNGCDGEIARSRELHYPCLVSASSMEIDSKIKDMCWLRRYGEESAFA